MKCLKRVFLGYVVIAIAPFAWADIASPDFTSGLTGWTFSGDVTATGGTGRLGDNGAYYSVLYQGVDTGPGTFTLSFDFQNALSGDVPDFMFPDVVFASLFFIDDIGSFDLSANSFDDVSPLFDSDYTGNVPYIGTIGASALGGDWLQYSVTFTTPYAYVIPTLELLNGNFVDNDSAFFVDNFIISPAVVPEPASVVLLGLGLVSLAGRRTGGRRKS